MCKDGVFVCVDENGIVFEAEVSRDEALATLELYKKTCPGLSSLNSLQGVLLAMDRSGVRTHRPTLTNTRTQTPSYTLTNIDTCLCVCVCVELVSGVSGSEVADQE